MGSTPDILAATTIREDASVRTLIIVAALVASGAEAQEKVAKASADVNRGRYLVATSGCNDCHTPGYPVSGGKVDEKLWMTGDKLGWRGPWGTTYASNLRLTASRMTETQFVALARNPQLRPPMPWFVLRDMNERDVRAIYRYLKHAGPAGEPAPAYLPPDKTPNPPFVQFPMK
jgi:mono/diheme cytochrome c family protein